MWRWLIGHPLAQIGYAVLALVAGVYDAWLLQISVWTLHGNDFGKFYYSAQQWRAGESLYAPNIATRMRAGAEWVEFLNVNPPHFHLAVLPFTLLRLEPATYAWHALNIAAAVIACWRIVRELGIVLRPRYALPALAAGLASGATGAIAVTGQYTGLLLLIVTSAWIAGRRRRALGTGVWLGIAISLKPFLGLFLPVLLVRRDFKAAFVAFLGLLGAGAIGLAVFGWSAQREWIETLSSVEWTWAAMNGSWRAILVRLLDRSPYYTPLTVAPTWVGALWILGASGVAVGTLRVAARGVDEAFAAATLGAALISPLGWFYYLWLALPAGAAVLCRTRRRRWLWVGLLSSCVPLSLVLLAQPSALATATIGSSYFWATLSLWTAVVTATSDQCPQKDAIRRPRSGD